MICPLEAVRGSGIVSDGRHNAHTFNSRPGAGDAKVDHLMASGTDHWDIRPHPAALAQEPDAAAFCGLIGRRYFPIRPTVGDILTLNNN